MHGTLSTSGDVKKNKELRRVCLQKRCMWRTWCNQAVAPLFCVFCVVLHLMFSPNVRIFFFRTSDAPIVGDFVQVS